MNLDFHYYATYAAARIAGYEAEDARTICYAAQFVDEVCGNENGVGQLIHNDLIENYKICTVQTAGNLRNAVLTNTLTDWRITNWSEKKLRCIRQTWLSFHFLPGNYVFLDDRKFPREIYTKEVLEETRNKNRFKSNFELMCIPNSDLMVAMILDTKAFHQNDPVMIGLRMHVLADTWSHAYYLGAAEYCINDLVNAKYANPKDLHDDRSSFLDVNFKGPFTNDDIRVNKFCRTPKGTIYHDSTYYIGHARAGHLPDYGCLRLLLRPRWLHGITSNSHYLQEIKNLYGSANQAEIEADLVDRKRIIGHEFSGVNDNEKEGMIPKDNRKFFIKAFAQMIEAMEYFRGVRVGFDKRQYKDLKAMHHSESGESLYDAVKKILSTWSKDQSEVWQDFIVNKLDGYINKVIAGPPPFRKEDWFNAFDKINADNPDRRNTYYFKFFEAAFYHKNFVYDYLSESLNIPIDSKIVDAPVRENRNFSDYDYSRRVVAGQNALAQMKRIAVYMSTTNIVGIKSYFELNGVSFCAPLRGGTWKDTLIRAELLTIEDNEIITNIQIMQHLGEFIAINFYIYNRNSHDRRNVVISADEKIPITEKITIPHDLENTNELIYFTGQCILQYMGDKVYSKLDMLEPHYA